MAHARTFVLALTFALLVATAASPPALDRPSWTAGDFWTYRTDTALLPGVNLTGSVTSTVEGRISTAVAGTTIDAWEVLVTGSGTAGGTVATANGPVEVNGTWILTGEQRWDPTDFQLVYDLLDLQANGTAQQFLPFSARVQNTTTFTVVANDWAYPLAPGTSGNVSALYNFTFDSYSTFYSPIHEQGTGQWKVSFAIAAPENVTVAAGTFSAYPITETWPDGGTERMFVSADVGNNVRTETYAPGGNLTGVTTLSAYRYQARETPTFLGLTTMEWAIGLAAIAVASVAVGLVWWRRRKRRVRSPGEAPASEPTSGPRGP